ncbi:MAG: endonuclease/exonuclease/phosphatase family protein [Myxococcales bacterium]|nr:endonuclease/exonuclease/phosphatase family protein [Myxococcales bacterium]USN50707.1 MAG: endonuclease/exonuclease/phosphatase family protein [Myxococcales bacterium]
MENCNEKNVNACSWAVFTIDKRKYDLLTENLQHKHKFYLSKKRPLFLLNTFLTNSGLAVFSKFPIVSSKYTFYEAIANCLPTQCAGDMLASKGVIMTRLNIDGAIIDVYNTHMHAGDKIVEHEARLKQIKQLINFINDNSSPDSSVILMGDFNMSPKREGKTRKQLKPSGHYSDQEDMIRRTSAFDQLIKGLGFTDAIDSITENKNVTAICKENYEKITSKKAKGGTCRQQPDEIDRILYRPGKYKLKLLGLRKDADRFLNDKGKRLSDGNPNVAIFQLSLP